MYCSSKICFCILLLLATGIGNAQTVDTSVARQILAAKDTLVRPAEKNPAFKETDSSKLKDPKARIPRKAAIRSAILPGWGQVYNKKIWKVPIVYAALGGTGVYFITSLTWFNRTKYAYTVARNIQLGVDSITGPNYAKVNAQLQRVFFEGPRGIDASGIQVQRDGFRRDVDYSAVYFIIAWALNIVDATVDAHLSRFDISPDLGFKIQPGYSEMARTSGVSLVLQFK